MNATKRKFNNLLQGIGTRSAPQDPEPTLNRLSSGSRREEEEDPLAAIDAILKQSSNTTPLDTNTSGSTPAMAINPVPNELFTKRRRVGVLGSKTGNENGNKPAKDGTTISNIVLKKWNPTTGTSTITSNSNLSTTSLSAPRYCPGDREQLIKRLSTFQELTEWTPKPDRVNEIEWAKRGWICNGKETVRCTLCNKELVVKVNKRTENGKEVNVTSGSEIEQALVNKFVELIVEAHGEDCLWRKRGCDDSLLRLPLTNAPNALAGLRERYDDLCSRPSFLPYLFNLRLPAELDLQAVKTQLPSNFYTEPAPPSTNPEISKPNDVALALALAGWQGLTHPRIGAVPNSATCVTCLRRLGLWMFKSKEVDPATNKILVPAPMDHLDPIREHRFFCPWRSSAVQRNPGSGERKKVESAGGKDLAAWQVLLQTLKNDSFLRGRTEKGFHTRAGSRVQISTPNTPRASASENRPSTPPGQVFGPDHEVDDNEEEESVRKAKDKERWARLRKVKSLFDTKTGKKLRRTLSRPGTAHSSRPPTVGGASRPGTGHHSIADSQS